MSRRGGPIRVAWCVDSFNIGGTELNAVRTAEAFSSADVELRVFHIHADGPLKSRYEKLGVPLVHVPIQGLVSMGALRQSRAFLRAIKQWPAQVVHCHDIYTNIFFGLSARLFSKTPVIASRRWWHYSPRSGLPTLNRWAGRLAHRVLANSESVARLLVTEEGVNSAKIIVVPNFLDDAATSPPSEADRAEFRRRYQIPAEAYLVGSVSRIESVKRLDVLVRAMQQLPPHIHAVLVGDGSEVDGLRKLARELGVEARVHFTGRILSPPNTHFQFDISVSCSESEGFPNSLIEAMAAGRPVVATPVGGVVDVLADGQTGLQFPVGDVDALAEKVLHLWKDTSASNDIAARGSALVKNRYQRRSVLRQLQDAYSSLCEC